MIVFVGIINIAFDTCGRKPYLSKNGNDIISFGHLLTQFS